MITGGSYGGYMTLAVSFATATKSVLARCGGDFQLQYVYENTEAYRRDLRRVEYGDERDPKIAAFFEEIAPLKPY